MVGLETRLFFSTKSNLTMAPICLLLLSFCASTLATLPIVDLGYERHQAAFFNVRTMDFPDPMTMTLMYQ